MKSDDASWHYGGDFPSDLPSDAGATHIGMFAAWCVLNGLAGSLHIEDLPEDLEDLKNREITPGDWLRRACDEKFTDEDLNEEGNRFASQYYAPEDAPYLADYEQALLDSLPSLYHVSDSWESYDRLAPFLRDRFEACRKGDG